MHHAQGKRRGRQRGTALIVVLVLVAAMVIYVAANAAALGCLRRFLDGVENQQVQRIHRS